MTWYSREEAEEAIIEDEDEEEVVEDAEVADADEPEELVEEPSLVEEAVDPPPAPSPGPIFTRGKNGGLVEI